MAQRKIVSVSVTPEQEAFLRDRVKCGRFGSVSEVVRAGLRLLERSEAADALPAQQHLPSIRPEGRRGKASKAR